MLQTALEGLRLGFSMLIVHAVGEPRYEPDGRGGFRRATDKKTSLPAVHGAKVPCGQWTHRQSEAATSDELMSHLRHPEYGPLRGVAAVCGFGDLEMFEGDDQQAWDRFVAAVNDDPEAKAIFDRVTAGYLELSPRGVPHTLWMCADLTGGGRLASRPILVEGDDGARKIKCLLETRGAGQISVIAPSPASCHKLNKPYVLQRGGLATIATITPAERQKLLSIARSFDEMPPEEPKAKPRPTPTRVTHNRPDGDEKPGEHFNRVFTVVMWKEMLADLGWEYIGDVSGREHCWVHSEATSSLSAHLTDGNNLLVFSTSTPFAAWSAEHRKATTPFAAYTLLNHKGDFSAAASALALLGYGTRPVEPTLVMNGKPINSRASERATNWANVDPVADANGQSAGGAKGPDGESSGNSHSDAPPDEKSRGRESRPGGWQPPPPPDTGAETGSQLFLQPLDELSVKPVRFIVPGRLPQGKATLLASDGGMGKSTLTRHLIACITTGRPAFGMDYDPPGRGR